MEFRRQPQVLILTVYIIKDRVWAFLSGMPDFIAHRLLCTPFSLPSLSLLEQCTSNCNSRHPVLKRFWGLKLTCFYVKFFNLISHLLSLRVHLFFFFKPGLYCFLKYYSVVCTSSYQEGKITLICFDSTDIPYLFYLQLLLSCLLQTYDNCKEKSSFFGGGLEMII